MCQLWVFFLQGWVVLQDENLKEESIAVTIMFLIQHLFSISIQKNGNGFEIECINLSMGRFMKVFKTMFL